ncbi:flagellar assembly protein FliW [Paenibacillus antri]|uniref:Flagellar assembly factor FliW n=1 Tax=Paenibacillus antri TaxID=2582848 RepID=A0A5R9G2J2_9BACL|nr:flagellar assembly protein FliW [Paenibacillus antri]TLS50572.1 flagellar assembly protein FliW [Paenibacillus antri]
MSIVIDSPVLGSINVEQGDIYSFPRGVPGFEDNKQFVIVQPEPGAPFAYLQSTESPDLVLLVTNPFLFYPSYDFELPDQVAEELGIEAKEDVEVWCVVTVPEQMERASVNLLAPIIVNVNARTGRQTILTNTPYATKHPLFPGATDEQRPAGGDGDAGTHP